MRLLRTLQLKNLSMRIFHRNVESFSPCVLYKGCSSAILDKGGVLNLEDFIKDLASDLQEKIRACKSAEELSALAAEEGVDLPDDLLDAVSGGVGFFASTPVCPQCGNTADVRLIDFPDKAWYHCYNCGYEWDCP